MLLSLLTAVLVAATPPDAGTIQGFVRVEQTYEPISFATVAIPALGRLVQTDAHGFFVLSGIPAGTWRVEAAAMGYRSNTLTVVTAQSGRLRLDFELQLKPVVIPGVTAEGSDESTSTSATTEAGPLPMRMEGAALKLMPGLAEADVLRALQALPAVSAISDYSTALYVRGGSADQNLIELDGMPLFNPYHVGGVFSAISADAVAGVDVWTGALPARTGDRISSAVVIDTREGGKDRSRVSGSLGLISTSITADGPLNKGRGSYLFSGRRTYVDAITGAAYGLGLIDVKMPYGFSDAYAKVTHRVGELGSLSISGYWDGESVGTPDRMQEDLGGYGDFNWGSRLLSLQFRKPLSGSLLLEARAGYSDFHGRFDGWGVARHLSCDPNGCTEVAPRDTTRVVDAKTLARDVVGAAHLTWYAPSHRLRGGVQLDAYKFEHHVAAIDWDEDMVPTFDQEAPVTTVAIYAEDEWNATEALTLRTGMRFLHAGGLGNALLPRFGLRWQITPVFALTGGAGMYAQALRSMKDDESVAASVIAYDLLTKQPDSVGLLRGSDVLAGFEYNAAHTGIRFDAFWKSASGLVLAHKPDDPIEIPVLLIDSFRTGKSNAYGAELSAHREFGRWSINTSYALLFAKRQADDGEVFTPRFERRHQFDIAALYKWGRAGILSARLVAASGQPHTPAVGLSSILAFDPRTGLWSGSSNVMVLGDHNSARLPGYFRIDIAARREYAKRWFGKDMIVTPYLQVINVLNNKNALIAEAQPGGNPRFNYWPQLPVLPTFGVEWRF